MKLKGLSKIKRQFYWWFVGRKKYNNFIKKLVITPTQISAKEIADGLESLVIKKGE